ncbi:MAG: hypothetical protein KKB95_01540 [Gammaproteobacteria bacterium]|nr:hypothetical protein [Gammaproteobacteria bacterium]MBU1504557.1 hypothetical protein [Gammaproteobacteria bacterium]MBU2119419.1 hypothetical protein [Gammaproteobacteria bacterium]MBU2202814.1 hypothetical protein [Gammaproteobacteria bacterium]MBU2272553.1 hypothetical protein [Gammaproteobacteria bacterium]
MNFDQFIAHLDGQSWSVRNKSFASKTFGEWQVSFIRMGGKFQLPGSVAFVVCVRRRGMRNLDKESLEVEKEPHAYPFKLSLQEIESGDFQYRSKSLRYDHSNRPVDSDWSLLAMHLERTIPAWLRRLTREALITQVSRFGESGYIERIWLEDLK